jgi:hypothetical protein
VAETDNDEIKVRERENVIRNEQLVTPRIIPQRIR